MRKPRQVYLMKPMHNATDVCTLQLKSRLEAQTLGRQEAEQTLQERAGQWVQERAELQEQAKASDNSWKAKVGRRGRDGGQCNGSPVFVSNQQGSACQPLFTAPTSRTKCVIPMCVC